MWRSPDVDSDASVDGSRVLTYQKDGSSDDNEVDVADDQPLLSSSTACRGVPHSTTSPHRDASTSTSCSPFASSEARSSLCRLLGVLVCVAFLFLFLLLLLAVVLALVYPSLDLASLCTPSESSVAFSVSIGRYTEPLLQRGCEVAHDSWRSLAVAASTTWSAIVTAIDFGEPSLPAVDPLRLALAHCLGHATNIPSPASASDSTHIHCPAPPAAIVATFFPDYLQLYPSVLTHTPRFSCDRGTYLWVDWQYTDGMGNSLWAYSVILSLAMAINATVLAFPFIATHIEYESHEERQRYFAFDEWEVHRSQWEQCAPDSAVKRNQYTLPRITAEYEASEPQLHAVRSWMRNVQVTQAEAANTTHLHASPTATADYRYMTADFTYATVALPRVDNDGPGLTVHLAELGIDGPWSLGMYAPGIEVAKVNEIRWIAQQLHWRRHTHPIEPHFQTTTVTHADSSPSTATADISSSSNSSNSSSPALGPTSVWLTSDDIHVAVPVRRGDVSGNTAGQQLLISIDMRARVMTDHAVASLLNQTIAVVRSIRAVNASAVAATSRLPLPSSTQRSFPATYHASPLSGAEVVSRLLFTVYSEGPADGFSVITDALLAAGIHPSRIRLRLNEKTSHTFTLLANSDLILMAPSSFSYAAACYFNSEGVHIGSGWHYQRFVGCHNLVYAQWRRYIISADEVKAGERYIPADDVSTQQWWGMSEEDAVELRRRVERLVARKERQRWSVEPIVLDNFREDYPRSWMYDQQRPELMLELHAPRVADRADTTTPPV